MQPPYGYTGGYSAGPGAGQVPAQQAPYGAGQQQPGFGAAGGPPPYTQPAPAPGGGGVAGYYPPPPQQAVQGYGQQAPMQQQQPQQYGSAAYGAPAPAAGAYGGAPTGVQASPPWAAMPPQGGGQQQQAYAVAPGATPAISQYGQALAAPQQQVPYAAPHAAGGQQQQQYLAAGQQQANGDAPAAQAQFPWTHVTAPPGYGTAAGSAQQPVSSGAPHSFPLSVRPISLLPQAPKGSLKRVCHWVGGSRRSTPIPSCIGASGAGAISTLAGQYC